ncbi:MAG: DUF4114 domain-containing protein [Phycisphaerae bacterium]
MIVSAALVTVLAVNATAVFANGITYTSFNDGFNAPLEPTHSQILDDIYGATFVASGLDFTNGTVTARRVFDQGSIMETLHLVTGDQNGVDQVWTDGISTVTASAKFALLNQSFGWNGGGMGTAYTELLTDADVGGPGVPVNIMGDFLWGSNPSSPDMWWSQEPQNTDGADHLITYKIDGLGTADTVWLLFWEDTAATTSDFDYNDFVVEVRAIPEPATAMFLIFGGVSLILRRKRS